MGRPTAWSIALLLITGCTTQSVTSVESVPTVEKQPDVPIVAVLPHHNVVQSQRQPLLATLAEQAQPDTIILVSPNHFAAGQAGTQTTDRIWTLENGTQHIFPNVDVIQQFVETGVLSNEDASFNEEHGIKNVISDLHDFFPQSTIVPIILKDTVTSEQIKLLAESLSEVCAECGLIASVDMSHYNPPAVAEVHDIKTLRALQTLNEEEIWQTEVDSQPSLALLLEWAKQQSTEQFILTDHTNSGGIETTSHLFGYYQTGNRPTVEDTITFTFAGDMMLGREIGYQFQNNNFQDLFTNFGDRVFWGTDIAWVNVEGPISDQNVIQDRQPDDLVFLFSKQAVAALTFLKLNVVGLANNHTANQGREGLDTTRQVITDANIAVVGDPYGINETSVWRKNHVSLVAVNVFDGDLTGLTELIAQEDAAGQFVIVLPHWGNEYQTTHSSRQEQLANDWIAAGADFIVGMHPHVVQDAQIIAGKLVLYSLGNFVFDQTFSQETQQGLIVTGSITDDALNVVVVPIVDRNLKPELANGDAKDNLIDRVCANITEYCEADVITVPL